MRTPISASVFLICLFTVGCGGEKTHSKVTVSKTWDMFAAKDYEAALNYFDNLIPTQGSPAIVGAGWCNIRLGKLADAEVYFAQASPLDPDGLTGWTLVLWGKGDVQDAIDKANAVLQINAQYVFSKDNRVDFRDLIWIQAASYFQLHEYTSCVSKLQLLDPNFTVELESADIDQLLLVKLQSLGAAHE